MLATSCAAPLEGADEEFEEDGYEATTGLTWYVSGTGDDRRDGRTPANAFRTIQKAVDRAGAGDTIQVMDGEYTNPCPQCAVVTINKSGTPTAWITLQAAPGHRPRLRFNGWQGVAVRGSASYIRISGLELVGPLQQLSIDQCRNQVANPVCNTNGIDISGRNSGANKPHHIRVDHNYVHHCTGGGISAIDADYVTVEENVVHDTSWYTQYASSGISFLTPWNFDDNRGIKMIVRRNFVYNNRTLLPWARIGRLSDGNGIIIDSTRSGSSGAYRGRTLVENNVSFNNGGSGIHSYKSERVDIVHNTAYSNGQVVGYAEIFAADSRDVRITNNVMVARPQGTVNAADSRNVNVTYDYNLYWNGTRIPVRGPNDLQADPRFVDVAANNFRLRLGSPAIDSGGGLTSTVDHEGRTRPQGLAPDRGAYEVPASGCSTYEAESTAGTSGRATPDGWILWSNGYIGTNHTFGGGRTRITVTARGQVANGVWPRMRVAVGETVVGEVTVGTSSWRTYDFDIDYAAGVAEIRVAFTNDYYVEGVADRNLFVDRVTAGCN